MSDILSVCDRLCRKQCPVRNTLALFHDVRLNTGLYRLPATEPQRTEWLSFMYEGQVPLNLPKVMYVCANHFRTDYFLNEGQYKAGFAKKLKLKDGSVPTIRDPASLQEVSVTLCIFIAFEQVIM